MKRLFRRSKLAILSATALLLGGFANNASATLIEVTVTNTSPTGGLSLTPLYFGFHNGSVDLFDLGMAASAGIAEIAETGDFGPLRDERIDMQGGSVGAAAFGFGGVIGDDPGEPPVLEPGESATFTIDLDAFANRFLFFASMILPSNDTYIGVDDPMQFALFDAVGNFLGPQTIDVTSAFAFDAGSEANDPNLGPAFVVGQDINLGGPGEGTIQAAMSLSDFVGLSLAGGMSLNPDLIDFINDPNFVFATISIREVPLPPALLLMGMGLGALGYKTKRQRKSHQ